MNRDALIAAFLARNGYAVAHAEPLPGDASLRRYLRLSNGPRPALLMDAPPPEDLRPFVRIAAHLASIGVSVPEIYALDEAAGLLLEEDLGDDMLSTALDSLSRAAGEGWGGGSRAAREDCGGGFSSEAAATRFDAAIDLLLEIQRAPPPPGLPRWDAATMASTALATLFDWWWPAMFGKPAPDAARADFALALHAMLAPVAAGPSCFVHRDFFAGNLLWLAEREGVRRIGLLDFQGAATGHPAYDLASLLQDSRREIPMELAERAFIRYLARIETEPPAAVPGAGPAFVVVPGEDPGTPALASVGAKTNDTLRTFRAAYAACAAQRHLRIAGQWVRLAQRDGRPGYLRYGPHTWRLLNRASQDPAAQPLAAALDRWIPPGRRCNPPGLAA